MSTHILHTLSSDIEQIKHEFRELNIISRNWSKFNIWKPSHKNAALNVNVAFLLLLFLQTEKLPFGILWIICVIGLSSIPPYYYFNWGSLHIAKTLIAKPWMEDKERSFQRFCFLLLVLTENSNKGYFKQKKWYRAYIYFICINLISIPVYPHTNSTVFLLCFMWDSCLRVCEMGKGDYFL